VTAGRQAGVAATTAAGARATAWMTIRAVHCPCGYASLGGGAPKRRNAGCSAAGSESRGRDSRCCRTAGVTRWPARLWQVNAGGAAHRRSCRLAPWRATPRAPQTRGSPPRSCRRASACRRSRRCRRSRSRLRGAPAGRCGGSPRALCRAPLGAPLRAGRVTRIEPSAWRRALATCAPLKAKRASPRAEHTTRRRPRAPQHGIRHPAHPTRSAWMCMQQRQAAGQGQATRDTGGSGARARANGEGARVRAHRW